MMQPRRKTTIWSNDAEAVAPPGRTTAAAAAAQAQGKAKSQVRETGTLEVRTCGAGSVSSVSWDTSTGSARHVYEPSQHGRPMAANVMQAAKRNSGSSSDEDAEELYEDLPAAAQRAAGGLKHGQLPASSSRCMLTALTLADSIASGKFQ